MFQHSAEVLCNTVIILQTPIEGSKQDLPERIGNGIKQTEITKGITIRDDIIKLDRENEDEAYAKLCSSISIGVSSIIDLSWSPWERATDLAGAAGIPIIRTYLDSQQLVTAMDSYLESRNATDAAILLESEADVDRTLYTLLGKSNVRIWVHAGLTKDSAKSLASMRPEPSFYAVKENLVKRKYRWNLVVTGFDPVDPAELVLPTVMLRLDPEQCCALLRSEKCKCPANIEKKQQILKNFILYITEAFVRLDIDDTPKVNCNDIQADNTTRDMLYKLFEEESANNASLFYWENSELQLRSNFILTVYDPEEGLQTVAQWSVTEPYRLLPGIELEPLRHFFRIGTYPAVPWTMQKIDSDSLPVFENGQPVYEGYCIDLIEKMAEETDIAVAALTMTAEREEVIDFVAPYPQANTKNIAFQVHDRLKDRSVAEHRGSSTADRIYDLDPGERLHSQRKFLVCVDVIHSSRWWRGSEGIIRQDSGRRILAVRSADTPVSSLEQLARQSRINYTVVASSTVHQYFINMKFAEDTLYRRSTGCGTIRSGSNMDTSCWLLKLQDQLLTLRRVFIKYEITRNCNLTEVGEVFAEQPYAIAVQQGSRLQEDLSRTLLDLQKERFLEQLSAKYWNETARQSCPDADESEGITLESLVFYYKRKEKNKIQNIDANIEKFEAFAKPKRSIQKKMTDGVAKLRKRKRVKTVTIGDSFKPADKGISYLGGFPKGDYIP
ncbi:unnamed protein product [Leptidea sinapis]|uniref:Ionotropic glutamate receptor C-terminal domain-containing protein n=1 Tax=Leptidea sinapis TaxID=189913 RepID=A0A5E4PP94_9NEOP|nr:unnamed protein product [Leptidea sinapis]